jgi:dihydrofolate synthase/folylpolyglutamate synthase
MAGYEATVEKIFNLRKFGGMKLGLERIRETCKQLGNPQEKYKIIHVAGSNGKGSTAAMAASILRAAGHRVGLYTSPHLSRFTERITVDGQEIPETDVVRLFEEVWNIESEEKPSFFEVTTAIAFKWFAEQNVDFSVIEVGLGGRLDATNVVKPTVSVITNIALEHTDILGDTLEKIATEKAGIIKEGVPLVTATQNISAYSIFKDRCKEKGSRLFRVGKDIRLERTGGNLDYQEFNLKGLNGNYEKLKLPLLGEHQLHNAAAAVGAVEALSLNGTDVPESAVRAGLEKVVWPGRMEIVQRTPLVILDCAKDVLGMESLRKAVTDVFDYERLILAVSISDDKKIGLMLEQILPITDYVIATRHKVRDRAIEPSVIADMAKTLGKKAEIVDDVRGAVSKAIGMANGNDMVLITGSVFTVGEARELWFKENGTKLGRELNER